MRQLVLSGGPTHDFAATTPILVSIAQDHGIESTVVEDPNEWFASLGSARGAAQWDLLTVNAFRWSMVQDRYAAQREEHAFHVTDGQLGALESLVEHGAGLLALHTAVICFDSHPTWRHLIGAAWDWKRSRHEPIGNVSVRPSARAGGHPMLAGITEFTLHDEVYRGVDVADDCTQLLDGEDAHTAAPVIWARTHGNGRVVTDLLGHDRTSFTPEHRRVIAAAMRWAVDRTEREGEHG